MAEVIGFEFNDEDWSIKMYAGDTGSKWLGGARKSGTAWTSADRCLFTVKSGNDIVMQRIYRLDDQWGAGDGIFLFELHNNDTDTWAPGTYDTEWRFNVNPAWEGGTAPEGRCVDALATGDRMIEGNIVRTKIKSTLEIKGVIGDI